MINRNARTTRTREISQKIDELHEDAASRRPAAC